MKKSELLKQIANECGNTTITTEILTKLGFQETIKNSWKLVEPISDRKDDYKNTIYVNFDEEGTAMLDINSIYGQIKVGNYYIYRSATIDDMVYAFKILNI